MQEMVEFTKQQLSYNNIELEELKILRMFLNKSIGLLKKEKEQISESYIDGLNCFYSLDDGTEYYNSKFGDNPEAGI